MKINAHLLGVWLLVGKKCFVAEMGLSWANKCICNLQWSHAGLNLLEKFWSSQRPEAWQCVHGTQWAELLLLLRLELQAHNWWKLNMSFWCLWQLDQCSPFSYGGYSGIRLVARRANKLQHVGPVIFAIQASKLRPIAQGSGVFLGHTGSVGAIPEVQEKLRWDSHTGKIPWTFGDDTSGRLRAWGWPQTERLLTFCWDQSQRSRTCWIKELHLFNLEFRLVLLPRRLIGTIDCCSMHETRTLLVWNLRTGWVLQKQFENEMLRLHITSVSLWACRTRGGVLTFKGAQCGSRRYVIHSFMAPKRCWFPTIVQQVGWSCFRTLEHLHTPLAQQFLAVWRCSLVSGQRIVDLWTHQSLHPSQQWLTILQKKFGSCCQQEILGLPAWFSLCYSLVGRIQQPYFTMNAQKYSSGGAAKNLDRSSWISNSDN